VYSQDCILHAKVVHTGWVIFAFLLIVSIALSIAAAVALWRFVFPMDQGRAAADADQLGSFSAESYLPMGHLLDDLDLRFLELQPGYRPEMAARVRADRRRIYLGYLQSLRRDFQGLSATLKYILIHSEQDRPELGMLLLRSQVAFAWGYACAEVRAYAWAHGWRGFNAGDPLRVFDGMCCELSRVLRSGSAA
jgi:hypothetical protein